MNLLNEMRDQKETLITWRRELHQIPELDLDLVKTYAYVEEKLNDWGVSYVKSPSNAGLIATFGKGGKCVAIRGDMDALPVKEDTGLPYASSNGNMHACGHDGHTAILLGAAKFLKEHEEEIPGTIKLIFQAGEENLIGAKLLVEEGALRNPDVDRFLSLHIGSLGGSGKAGDVLIKKNTSFLASLCFEIEITGKSGHAASPHLTVDPMVTASEVILALQMIVSREIKPGTLGLISCTTISTPTDAYNIIPQSVLIKGTIRAEDPEVHEYLAKRTEEVVQEVARSHRAQGEFRRIYGAPALVNDNEAVEDTLASAKKVLGDDKAYLINNVNMGSEDAAFFCEKVPGCYIFFCNEQKDEHGNVWPHHNAKFRIDDSYLYQAAAVMLQAAFDYLEK